MAIMKREYLNNIIDYKVKIDKRHPNSPEAAWHVYPVCDIGKTFANIAESKTLPIRVRVYMAYLGYLPVDVDGDDTLRHNLENVLDNRGGTGF